MSGTAGAGGGTRAGREPEAGFGLVEVLVALTILAVGLLAVAGLTWSVARQTRQAAIRTEQTLAAQQVLEAMTTRGYAGLALGTSDTTLLVGEHEYAVTRRVTREGEHLKRLAATVAGRDGVSERTFATLLDSGWALP